MDDIVEQVLGSGTVPDGDFEPGVPLPVAYWAGERCGFVLFLLCRRDGVYDYLAASAQRDAELRWQADGTDFGGGGMDAFPDRSGSDLVADGIWLLGKIGTGNAQAVLGFAAAGIETVRFDSQYLEAEVAVHPRTGAFIIGLEEAVYPVTACVAGPCDEAEHRRWPQVTFENPWRDRELESEVDAGAEGLELVDVIAPSDRSVEHVLLRVAREDPEQNSGVQLEWFARIQGRYVGTGPAQGVESWNLDREADEYSDDELAAEMQRIVAEQPRTNPDRWSRLIDALSAEGYEVGQEALDRAPLKIVIDNKSRPLMEF